MYNQFSQQDRLHKMYTHDKWYISEISTPMNIAANMCSQQSHVIIDFSAKYLFRDGDNW